MGVPQSAPNLGQAPPVLRVHSISKHGEDRLRILETVGKGVWTHHRSKGSVICGREKCPPAEHRKGGQWKGYAFSLLWLPLEKRWLPTILEVPENLELDLRNQLVPGEAWVCWREHNEAKKTQKVRGRRAGPAVDFSHLKIESALQGARRVYHDPFLEFWLDNPMPDRVLVEMIEDFGIVKPLPPEPKPETTGELLSRYRTRLQETRGAAS